MPSSLPGAGWRGHLLALLSGALLTLSFAPFGLWPLGLLGVALYNGLLQRLSPSQAAWRSYAFGIGLFGSGTSWVYVSIQVYGAAPVPLAALLTALFCLGLALLFALFGYVYARWLRPATGGRIWGFAALWVLLDWLRSWLLSGFPWLYSGYAHLDTPLAGWAPIGGVWLVSFAALATAGWIAQLVEERRLRWLSAALVAGFWLGGWGWNQMQWTSPSGEVRKVALVQANIPQSVKWSPDQFWPTLALYQKMSAPLWHDHDLVIWPEAAIPGFFQTAEGFLSQLHSANNSATLITGSPWRERIFLSRPNARQSLGGLVPNGQVSNGQALNGQASVDQTIPGQAGLGFLDDRAPGVRISGPANSTAPSEQAIATEYRVYNSLIVVPPENSASIARTHLDHTVYHKQYLVPFGEFVPLERWLRGLIAFFDLPMSSFSAGSGDQTALVAGGMTLAPAICYEVVYPEQLRQFLPNADVLITVSNDAWFGRSIGPHQHLQMAQMRALEYGREMVRSTGNGVTALIDNRGQIKQRLPQFERGVLSGEVQPYTGRTPFTTIGTLPWIGLMLGITAALTLSRRGR